MPYTRPSGRAHDELRPVEIQRRFLRTAPGSVLYRSGGTVVLCTASLSESVPEWMVGRGRGWLTAEYNMLPASTSPRKRRDRDGKVDGRTTEIQRLIGRSLRTVIDFKALGERTLTVDCDVLEADGGTRTASITGAWVAVVDALAAADLPATIARQSVAAISVGIVDGEVLLDLDYSEDAAASVDMNVVMTGPGEYIEVQGTGERTTFDRRQLDRLLDLAAQGIAGLTELQRKSLQTSDT